MDDPNAIASALEAAKARRAELGIEKLQIQGQMGRLSGRLRAQAVARLVEIEKEIAKVKASIHRFATAEDDYKRKWQVVTDPDNRKRILADSIKEFMEYVLFLERENAQLRAKVERLESGSESIEF